MTTKENASLDIDIVNIAIGRRIRNLRKSRGISDDELAKFLNISVRLYHKYEKGISEIPHDALWRFSKYFNIDIDRFFEGLSTQENIKISDNKEARKMLWGFLNIRNTQVADGILKLVKELAKEDSHK